MVGGASFCLHIRILFSLSPELQPDEFTAWERLASGAGGPAAILFTRTLSWTFFFQVFLWGKSLSGDVSFLPYHPQVLDHPGSKAVLTSCHWNQCGHHTVNTVHMIIQSLHTGLKFRELGCLCGPCHQSVGRHWVIYHTVPEFPCL